MERVLFRDAVARDLQPPTSDYQLDDDLYARHSHQKPTQDHVAPLGSYQCQANRTDHHNWKNFTRYPAQWHRRQLPIVRTFLVRSKII
jgi:hypothetical protein